MKKKVKTRFFGDKNHPERMDYFLNNMLQSVLFNTNINKLTNFNTP